MYTDLHIHTYIRNADCFAVAAFTRSAVLILFARLLCSGCCPRRRLLLKTIKRFKKFEGIEKKKNAVQGASGLVVLWTTDARLQGFSFSQA